MWWKLCFWKLNAWKLCSTDVIILQIHKSSFKSIRIAFWMMENWQIWRRNFVSLRFEFEKISFSLEFEIIKLEDLNFLNNSSSININKVLFLQNLLRLKFNAKNYITRIIKIRRDSQMNEKMIYFKGRDFIGKFLK